MYHLSTADRQIRIKKWQHNAAFGMVRAITDVFSSSLTEKPITFNVTGINKKGRENVKMPYLVKKMLEKKYGKKYD